MPKNSTIFVCAECGATSPRWLGRCPSCGKFNTMAEEVVKDSKPAAAARGAVYSAPRARKLSDVTFERYERTPSGISEFDNVLGGGIVAGSLVLLGGDPGIGKSTLLTQIAAHLSLKHRVLYFSAEESCSQVKMRAERLHLYCEDFLIVNDTCIDNLESELEGVKFCIIDSIQAVYTDDLSSSAGSVGQVRECATKLMRIAKSRGITFFIVGHVTKEGALAGPKVLEHIMDTVLYFEGENQENYRILRAVKNRFGNVSEVGVFEMTGEDIIAVTDYSGIFLSESRGQEAGCAVTPAQTGNRCMNVEIQTLISKTSFGQPRRMPLGIDYNKLVLLLAVLEKRCSLPFYTYDVYINVMGGIKLNEPACDLAVCAALASAHKDVPIDKFTAVFGEVGLTGEVRAVQYAEKRVQECVKMGFKRVILPAKNMKSVAKYADKINIVPVLYVNSMIKALFKQPE
ncbi:MAG TPA: DNA repair protein RadA [Candidatus Coproplasma avicola]|uniref:DNA repair protein RadA n=1 Tax=Candidatus Coproplasma avicola TaxID=2840744 RepID=A0A9D1E5L8_9FIRM|nr:DNA repair protein RadA [Candidatus Coproplasma avicola]